MHELSITRKLVEMIKSECKENNIDNPKKIVVEVGKLTNYKKQPIKFYFDLLKKEEDLIKNSELILNTIPGKIKCNNSGKKSQVDFEVMIFCPECDSHDVEIIEGKDIKLKEIFKKDK